MSSMGYCQNLSRPNMGLRNYLIFVIMLLSAVTSSGQLIPFDTATPTAGNTSVTESNQSGIHICDGYKCIGRDQCDGNEYSFVCKCDKECALYNDCCWTADGKCKDRIELHSGVTTTKICKYTHNAYTLSGFAIKLGYFMIASCPSHYPNNNVKKRCHRGLPLHPKSLEEYIHHVPVFSYKSKETYTNFYCATCNDVDYKDMRFWQLLSETCDINEPAAECDDVAFQPRPEMFEESLPRKCFISDPIKCSPSSPFYEQCMSYSAVISVMGMTFRNPHCALCYNSTLIFQDNEICPYDVDGLVFIDEGNQILITVPFDFSVFDKKNVSYKTVTCSRGLFYNSSSELCDFDPGSTIINASDDINQLCCQVTIRFELNSKNSLNLKSNITDTLSETAIRYFSLPYYNVDCYIALNKTVILNFPLRYVETFEEIYQTADRFTRHVIENDEFPIELSDVTANCSSCFSIFCHKETRFDPSEVVFFTHEGITSAKVNNLNIVYSDVTWDVTSQGVCTGNHTCKRNTTVVICSWLEKRPLCPFRVFTNNSFSLEENEKGTLHLLSDGIEGAVPPLDYVILTNGNACVCSRYYEEQVDVIILILYIVLTSLSLIALLLTFVTYCTFKNLRNLPGKITMNFVVSLFFAQIVLIPGPFSTTNYPTCYMIGVLGHYLWLSTFLWMSVTAFEISRTFGLKSPSLSHVTKNTKTFIIYLFIGWGIPCLHVALCVFIQRLHIHNIQFSYADPEVKCWLSPARSNFFLFGIPVILCLSFNYINFIFTARGLHRSKKNEKMVKSQTSSSEMMKQEIFLVLKVSILVGLCWTWSILYGFFQDSVVLLYLHTILNPLQGFFVFCIYVCNKRRLSMWRDTFRKLCSQSESTKGPHTRNTDSNSRSHAQTKSTAL